MHTVLPCHAPARLWPCDTPGQAMRAYARYCSRAGLVSLAIVVTCAHLPMLAAVKH